MSFHRSHEELHRSLTNQPPINAQVVTNFEGVRGEAKDLASAIIALVPDSRERSIALTKLEEVVMWAIKGIALNQEQI